MVFRVSFALSLALHGAAVALAWLLPAPVPRTGLAAQRRISHIPLVPPPPPSRRIPRQSMAAAPARITAPPPRRLEYRIPPRAAHPVLSAPELRSAAVRPPAAPGVPAIAVPAPPAVSAGFEDLAERAHPERQARPRLAVAAVFGTPAAPGPDQERARLRLKTGTFDAAPPASGRAPERAAGARVGSFDAVRGEPGVEPARARLEPAGAVFAAAAAGPAGAGAGPGPARRTEPGAGFPGAEAAAAIPSAPRPSPAPALDQGVTILEKPRPDYTPEARAARIEGEVLLEVVFTAGGEVRVRRVRRGLGHGLDENAVAAARRIRFRPATAGGRAVDFEATIRVAFQLAY